MAVFDRICMKSPNSQRKKEIEKNRGCGERERERGETQKRIEKEQKKEERIQQEKEIANWEKSMDHSYFSDSLYIIFVLNFIMN